jgi:hypothetical protein
MRCDEVLTLRDERRGDGTAGRTMGRADPEDPRYHNVVFKKSNTASGKTDVSPNAAPGDNTRVRGVPR